MKNKTYTNIVSKIAKLEKKKSDDILKCNNLIAEKEAAIQEADKYLNAETDVDKFLKASISKTEAEAVIDACRKKIDLIKSEGILSDEEYKHDLESIRSEQQAICENAIKQIATLLDELFPLYDAVHSQVEDLNDLASKLSRIAHQKNSVIMCNNDLYSFMNNTVGWLENKIKSDSTYSELIKNS